ncbi:hypothetical protein [Kangiella sp.]|uniref:hypothetical protein n=1 Tax=Kangiella sp. TaxID=1920245 RepID=UPI0025C19E14|nr:hypothetical protein [Kangiella sp.]
MNLSDSRLTPGFRCIESPYLMPFDGKLSLSQQPTKPIEQLSKEDYKAQLKVNSDSLYHLQHKMYADNRFSLLLIFQALDAAGKDSTIRKVFSGINPAGFQVHSFKQPSPQELEHDFLWRTVKALPERGRIGILIAVTMKKFWLLEYIPNTCLISIYQT